jgi:hypothetical protein
LTVTDTGAHLEFDCASGDIPRPLTVDDRGDLRANGVLVRERPGAVRLGEEPARQAARYAGRLDGQTLRFDVTLGAKEVFGHFTVTLGAAPRVRKCR